MEAKTGCLLKFFSIPLMKDGPYEQTQQPKKGSYFIIMGTPGLLCFPLMSVGIGPLGEFFYSVYEGWAAGWDKPPWFITRNPELLKILGTDVQ